METRRKRGNRARSTFLLSSPSVSNSWTENYDDDDDDDDGLVQIMASGLVQPVSELFQKRVTIGIVLAVGLVVSTTLVGSRPKTFSSPSSTTPSST